MALLFRGARRQLVLSRTIKLELLKVWPSERNHSDAGSVGHWLGQKAALRAGTRCALPYSELMPADRSRFPPGTPTRLTIIPDDHHVPYAGITGDGKQFILSNELFGGDAAGMTSLTCRTRVVPDLMGTLTYRPYDSNWTQAARRTNMTGQRLGSHGRRVQVARRIRPGPSRARAAADR